MKTITPDIVDIIAKVTHEANRAYCEMVQDFSQSCWEMAPDWQRKSAKQGVIFLLERPDSKPSDGHANWLKQKETEGWVCGDVKDPDAKPPTHPCMVPFEKLPEAQRMKDFIFWGIVTSMAKGYGLR